MRLATDATNDLRLFVPWTKREVQPDGSVVVEGIATCEELDKQGEIVGYEASKAAFSEWSDYFTKLTDGESIGNIREMHGPVAIGKGIAWWDIPDKRAIGLRSRIVDQNAVRKVNEKVLNGYSVAAPGKTLKRELRKVNGNNVPFVSQYRLSEVSLVDSPAAPSSEGLTLVKRAERLTWTPALVNAEIKAGRLALGSNLDLMKDCSYAGLAERLNAGELEVRGRQIVERPAAPPPPMKKGMWMVGNLSRIIDDLNALMCSCESEGVYENDARDTALAARIKTAITDLGGILSDMVNDELSEIVGGASAEEMTMKAEEITQAVEEGMKKGLTSLSESITKAIADGLKAAAPAPAPAKEEPAKDAAKAADAAPAAADVLADLKKRVDELDAALRTKGAVKVVAVDKAEDGAPGVQKIDLEKATPLDLIKMQHKAGGTPALAPTARS